MLKGKRVMITGASRGIGLEFVRQLINAGAKVIAAARHPEKSPHLLQLSQDHPQSLSTVVLDVADETSIHAACESLSGMGIDLLINNAGVFFDRRETFDNIGADKILDTFRVNVIGPLLVSQAMLPFLRRSNSPTIVNITSLMGSIADNTSGGSYGYRISKAALNMLAKTMSVDLKDLTVLNLHPGWVKTEMGGGQAPLSPEESVKGMISVIEHSSREKSGTFADYAGRDLPW